ncbi:MAG: AIM24 family protein, partial [Candidatus Bathyarchaeia archaeon]
DDTCRYDVKKFGGLKSTILGGEGLVTEVYGPGEVYIQTKNIREFVDWLWELLHARVETTARTTAMEKGERRYRLQLRQTEIMANLVSSYFSNCVKYCLCASR